jgi:hypothetical protein
MIDEDSVMELKPITGDDGENDEDRPADLVSPTTVAVGQASEAAGEMGGVRPTTLPELPGVRYMQPGRYQT